MLKYQTYKVKKYTKRMLTIESTKIKALQIEREYIKLSLSYALIEYPHLNAYLKQSSQLIDKGGIQFENVELCNMPDEDLIGLINELNSAPENVNSLVMRQSDLLKEIAYIQNPMKSFFLDTKKNIELHFLNAMLFLMLKYLNNREKHHEIEKTRQKEEEIKNSGFLCTT